jgi:hypothetical protein
LAVAGSESCDEEISALHQLPLNECTTARDTLAKRIQAAGERDRAGEVKQRRKPTVPAWARSGIATKTTRSLSLVTKAEPDEE